MKMPSTEAIDTAVSWLRYNEGGDGEADRCRVVADWIEYEERERMIRIEARRAGLPVAAVRRRLAETTD